ncbi:MAG TPA: DUF4097 family beta strand repeat-containing protein [Pyrinomonadaceae bacterium]|nr:DUF4097 family beta strand repeat-containing protein [Pyrinomonadaceae bacterium]
MKFSPLTILFALLLTAAPSAAARQQAGESPLERRADAEARAVVSVCVNSGDVIVRGWDRNEVRARIGGEGTLLLLTPNVRPAPRVEVRVSDERDADLNSRRCGSQETVELTVPRGATVEVESQSGHVEVADVAEARVKVFSGDVEVRRVSRAVQVSCMSGDVSVSDSAGPVRVDTVSGDVEARNLRTTSAGDNLQAKSVSGDVTIEGVAHGNVTGSVTSGNLLYTGALARGGSYDFRTISGDVTMELPANASFNLHAKVVVSGEIITDFPVKTVALTSSGVPAPPAPPAPPGPVAGEPPPAKKGPKVKVHRDHESARLDGTVGTGDAVVNLSSFSGSLHLIKR